MAQELVEIKGKEQHLGLAGALLATPLGCVGFPSCEEEEGKGRPLLPFLLRASSAPLSAQQGGKRDPGSPSCTEMGINGWGGSLVLTNHAGQETARFLSISTLFSIDAKGRTDQKWIMLANNKNYYYYYNKYKQTTDSLVLPKPECPSPVQVSLCPSLCPEMTLKTCWECRGLGLVVPAGLQKCPSCI